MRVVSVVGARPQFVKLEPVNASLETAGIEHLVIHTGQHYDFLMSQVFFDGLNLPVPCWNLGVGSSASAPMTASILTGVAEILEGMKPDWLLVYGDTNSTLAAALAARQVGVSLAHVEAGLRSFDRQMPEELNRTLTDHAADLLLAPTVTAMSHLASEGLASRSMLVGDVMADLLIRTRSKLQRKTQEETYVVCTLHRASNTDDSARLRHLLARLQEIPAKVVLIAHPRLRDRAKRFGVSLNLSNVTFSEPLAYLDMLSCMAGAAGVVTDSGGLQKEACLLGIPCTTLRSQTEWVETLEDDRNVLDPDGMSLGFLALREPEDSPWNPYGDGNAAGKIVSALREASS